MLLREEAVEREETGTHPLVVDDVGLPSANIVHPGDVYTDCCNDWDLERDWAIVPEINIEHYVVDNSTT